MAAKIMPEKTPTGPGTAYATKCNTQQKCGQTTPNSLDAKRQKMRVGGMSRKAFKSAALFAYGQLTGVWRPSLSQSLPTL